MQKTMTVREYIKAFNERNISTLLILLWCADLVFILLYCIDRAIPTPNNPMLNIGTERSYSEVFQYIKFIWMILLLIYFSLKNKSLRYVAWALLVTYFLVDDSFAVHEKLGLRIGASLNFTPPFGLGPKDLGELAVIATAGILLSLPLIWAYWSGSQTFRKVSQDIALLVLVLVFFAFVLDMVHSAISAGKLVDLIMRVVEDGGEMLAASLLFWYIFLLKARGDNTGYYLCDLGRTILTRRRF